MIIISFHHQRRRDLLGIAARFDQKCETGDERHLQSGGKFVCVIKEVKQKLAAQRPRQFTGGETAEPIEETIRYFIRCSLQKAKGAVVVLKMIDDNRVVVIISSRRRQKFKIIIIIIVITN